MREHNRRFLVFVCIVSTGYASVLPTLREQDARSTSKDIQTAMEADQVNQLQKTFALQSSIANGVDTSAKQGQKAKPVKPGEFHTKPLPGGPFGGIKKEEVLQPSDSKPNVKSEDIQSQIPSSLQDPQPQLVAAVPTKTVASQEEADESNPMKFSIGKPIPRPNKPVGGHKGDSQNDEDKNEIPESGASAAEIHGLEIPFNFKPHAHPTSTINLEDIKPQVLSTPTGSGESNLMSNEIANSVITKDENPQNANAEMQSQSEVDALDVNSDGNPTKVYLGSTNVVFKPAEIVIPIVKPMQNSADISAEASVASPTLQHVIALIQQNIQHVQSQLAAEQQQAQDVQLQMPETHSVSESENVNDVILPNDGLPPKSASIVSAEAPSGVPVPVPAVPQKEELIQLAPVGDAEVTVESAPAAVPVQSSPIAQIVLPVQSAPIPHMESEISSVNVLLQSDHNPQNHFPHQSASPVEQIEMPVETAPTTQVEIPIQSATIAQIEESAPLAPVETQSPNTDVKIQPNPMKGVLESEYDLSVSGVTDMNTENQPEQFDDFEVEEDDSELYMTPAAYELPAPMENSNSGMELTGTQNIPVSNIVVPIFATQTPGQSVAGVTKPPIMSSALLQYLIFNILSRRPIKPEQSVNLANANAEPGLQAPPPTQPLPNPNQSVDVNLLLQYINQAMHNQLTAALQSQQPNNIVSSSTTVTVPADIGAPAEFMLIAPNGQTLQGGYISPDGGLGPIQGSASQPSVLIIYNMTGTNVIGSLPQFESLATPQASIAEPAEEELTSPSIAEVDEEYQVEDVGQFSGNTKKRPSGKKPYKPNEKPNAKPNDKPNGKPNSKPKPPSGDSQPNNQAPNLLTGSATALLPTVIYLPHRDNYSYANSSNLNQNSSQSNAQPASANMSSDYVAPTPSDDNSIHVITIDIVEGQKNAGGAVVIEKAEQKPPAITVSLVSKPEVVTGSAKPVQQKPNSNKPKPSKPGNSDKNKPKPTGQKPKPPFGFGFGGKKPSTGGKVETTNSSGTAPSNPNASQPAKPSRPSVWPWPSFAKVFHNFFGSRQRADALMPENQEPCVSTADVIPRDADDNRPLCGITAAKDGYTCDKLCADSGFPQATCRDDNSCVCAYTDTSEVGLKMEYYYDRNLTNSENYYPVYDSCSNCSCPNLCTEAGYFMGVCGNTCYCGRPFVDGVPLELYPISHEPQ